MQQTITTSEIQGTKTYKNLDKMFQNLLIKYTSRQQITYGLNVFSNTGVIPGSIGGNTLRVLKELISNENQQK